MAGLIVFLALTSSVGVTASAAEPAKPDIPTAVRTQLLKVAEQRASLNGDQHPYDIEAVRTTHRRTDPDTAVYIVAMRGHFVCNCSAPPRAPLPRGTVITLEITAATMQTFGFTLGHRYPHLDSIGAPVHLYPAGQ